MIARTSTLKAVIKPNRPRLVNSKGIDTIIYNLEQVKKQQAAIRRYYQARLRG